MKDRSSVLRLAAGGVAAAILVMRAAPAVPPSGDVRMTPTSTTASKSMLALGFSSPDEVFFPDTSIRIEGTESPAPGQTTATARLRVRTVVINTNRMISLVDPITLPGNYIVTVTNPSRGGGSLLFPLHIAPVTKPVIGSFYPTSVQVGDWVIDTGLGFIPPVPAGSSPFPPPPGVETAPETTVRIGNVVASILAVTDTVIVFQVPPGAETGRINVTTPIGSATSSSDLTFLPRSTPSIAFASPSSGPTAGGTSVTVKGSGFRPEATVTFGSAAAGGVRVLSDTSLTVLSPFSPSAGSVPLTVTNADGGTATMTGAYSYAAGTGTAIRLIPVVLDVVSNAGATPAHFTTETTLTNSGTSAADLAFTYTASLGAGSGTVFDTLAPGGQLAIPDTIAYLRTRGLSLPTSGSQLGTLAVQFGNISSVDAVAVTARTTTATAVPQPVGAAGLAYSGLLSSDGLTTSATIYGLRQSESDRSNVAVFNTGSDPVTLKVTAFAGDGSADSSVADPGITLPSGGWRQYTGILGGAGYVNGWATVERTSSTGSFGTYGVINDQTTNDGSYLPPAAGFVKPFLPPAITLPAIVESASFLSEMVVSNRSPSAVTFLLSYTESLTPGDGSLQGTVPLALRPGEQLIIPGAVDFFRRLGVPIGAQGQGSYAGSVRALVLGGTLDQVFIGARTAAQSPAGGQYGLFTPGVYAGQEATASAWIYGLRADQDNRSNVAVVNAGQDSDGPVTLSLQVYDAGAGGAAAGTPETKTLNPGKWYQYGNFLASKGVANGWVKVTRMAGSAPWIAYGVVNDGGAPGQRTGDGEYVPMSR